MKVIEEKRVSKELRKLPPHIQKKYTQFLKEVMISSSLYHINQKWGVKKMDYDDNIYRAKLDLSYRVGLYKNETTGSVDVIKVSSRENFNYIGSK
jgi:mRNA-degrading endonuclease RelE of RelBE toxin-antitoxin system